MSKVDHQWVSAPTALANDQCGAGFCLAKYSDHPQQARGAAMSDDAMRLLENLTPGGSEFFNDPKRCAEWVERRLSETHRITVAAVKARNDAQSRAEAAEQQAARLRAALQAVMRRIDRSGNACWCPPIFDDRAFHTSDCLRARAALAASQPAPAAEDERGGQAKGAG